MSIVLIIVSSALLVYAYILYPLIIAALAKLRPRPSLYDESYIPKISVILSAYNEEEHLGACLDSLFAQGYPTEQFEILAGSDGSLDATNLILSQYAAKHPSLRIFLFESRRGKMRVLNDLTREASGEILFFVDADM